jgi:outer membrane protein TolC
MYMVKKLDYSGKILEIAHAAQKKGQVAEAAVEFTDAVVTKVQEKQTEVYQNQLNDKKEELVELLKNNVEF